MLPHIGKLKDFEGSALPENRLFNFLYIVTHNDSHEIITIRESRLPDVSGFFGNVVETVVPSPKLVPGSPFSLLMFILTMTSIVAFGFRVDCLFLAFCPFLHVRMIKFIISISFKVQTAASRT